MARLGLNETLLGVIDELYAGALDEARASGSLDKLASVAGASGGIMYLVDEIEHRVINSVSRNFAFDAPTQVDGDHARMIAAYHRQIPLGSAIHIHSLWPMEHMLKTPFYNEVLRKQDVMYGAACLFHRTPRVHGLITLNRSGRAGPFEESTFRVLWALAPHVRRAMQVATELGGAARERENFVAALNHLSVGVVLADGKGRVLHLNSAMEQFVSGGDGFAIRGGHLVAAIHQEQRRIEHLIGLATCGGAGQSFQRSGTCAVTRPSGKAPWLVLVAPCGQLHTADSVFSRTVCLILIRDPMTRGRNTGSELQKVFGLTAQESKVAVAIAEGHGIGHVSDRMGLSALTVRNHLQRVFAKTNTTRQAELVRLVAALGAELAQ